MLTPREQGGGLAEGSRLLQEGLQLLDERKREVDAILEDARERALVIKDEAEQHAQQLTADAERQRAELEEQVAALRSEAAALREELAAMRSPPRGSRGARQAVAAPVVTATLTGEANPPSAIAQSATGESPLPAEEAAAESVASASDAAQPEAREAA